MGSAEAIALLSPTDVARLTGQAIGTLMNWRYRRIGPPFIKIGRKVWYDTQDLRAWIASRKQVTSDASETTKRKLALQVLRGGPDVDGRHRIGGHKTQRERRPLRGGGGTALCESGPGRGAPAGSEDVQ